MAIYSWLCLIYCIKNMVIFHSYVSLPEGDWIVPSLSKCHCLHSNIGTWNIHWRIAMQKSIERSMCEWCKFTAVNRYTTCKRMASMHLFKVSSHKFIHSDGPLLQMVWAIKRLHDRAPRVGEHAKTWIAGCMHMFHSFVFLVVMYCTFLFLWVAAWFYDACDAKCHGLWINTLGCSTGQSQVHLVPMQKLDLSVAEALWSQCDPTCERGWSPCQQIPG